MPFGADSALFQSARPLSREQRLLVRRETAIGVVASMVAGTIAFLVVFGWGKPVPVRGLSGFAVDFLPQTFMIVLMGSLVPGLLTARRVRTGKIAALSGARRISVVARSVIVALSAMAVFGGGALAASMLSGATVLDARAAFLLKLAYSGCIALAITPSAVVASLRRRAPSPRRRRPARSSASASASA